MTDIPRFFIEPNKIFNDKFVLENPRDIKKIRQVLRMQQGDLIILLDNNNHIYRASIGRLKKNGITGNIIAKDFIEEEYNKPKIILAQALTRAGKMDDIIRMNTEIGIDSFVPFESDHSIFKLKQFKPQKLDRWTKIATEAAKQSERFAIPSIGHPISFFEVLNIPADIKILLHSRKVTNSQNIRSIKTKLTENGIILALVGPEGGFSSREIQKAIESGFTIIYLDTPILRTETAGIVLSAILLY